MSISIIGESAPEGGKCSLEELKKMLIEEDRVRDFNNNGVHPRMFIMGNPVDSLDKDDLIRLIRIIGRFK